MIFLPLFLKLCWPPELNKKCEKVALPVSALVLAMPSPSSHRTLSWSSACVVIADPQQVGQGAHGESTGLLM